MKAIDALFSFKGKVIIITGAAGAIGSAAGHLFASLGANVFISDLNEEGAKKVAAEITKESVVEALGIKTNATVESVLEELVNVTVKQFGRISGLINNVGRGANTPVWGSDTDNTEGAFGYVLYEAPGKPHRNYLRRDVIDERCSPVDHRYRPSY